MLAASLVLLFSRLPAMNETTDPIAKKTYTDLSNFEGVALLSSYDVSVQYGDEHKVILEGAEKWIKKATIKVENKVLYLDLKKGKHNDVQLKATVILPRLSYAAVMGSGELRINAFSNLEQLAVVANGSGDIYTAGELYIKGDINIHMAGSGTVRLKGSASHSDIQIMGSGNCEAAQLATLTNVTQIMGSGTATIQAREHVKARLMGSGNLYYEGAPTIEQVVSGSGKVRNQ